MQIGVIAGANLFLGAPKDWDQERDGLCGSLPVVVAVDEHGQRSFTSAWQLNQEEMLAVLSGGTIYLQIKSTVHPVVAMWVEQPPADDDNPYGGDNAESRNR